jgi:NSS family neurotransmitter:Na+ symporter
MVPGLAEANSFEALDHVTSNVMLPVVGFLLAIFSGWIMPEQLLRDEIGVGPTMLALLRIVLRYVAPVGIAAAVLTPLFI